MAKKKSTKADKKPKVNKDLEGFDINVNSFGEVVTSYDIDKLNEFLDKNVEDKKLKGNSDRSQEDEEEEEKKGKKKKGK